MNKIKANARRLLVAHGFPGMIEAVDALDSPHGIRTLVAKLCVPVAVDASKVGNNPSYCAGMFDLLVIQLDASPNLDSYETV